MKVRNPRPVVLLAAVLVLVVSGGTWAWSAVPDAGKQFHGCYVKDKSLPYKYFVMIDPAEGTKCPTGYAAVDWSAGGSTHGYAVTGNNDVTLDVPAGSYAISGKAEVASGFDPGSHLVTCSLRRDGVELDLARASSGSYLRTTLPVQSTSALTTAATLSMSCRADGSPDPDVATAMKLSAVPLGAVN